MNDFAQWLILHTDQIPTGGLFLVGFGVFIVALYREWIVLGGPYRTCMNRVDAFEAQATERAEANEARAEQTEARFESYKADTDAKLARLEVENAFLRERADRRR